MELYHATDWSAAESIERSGKFRPGKRGFAGGAIYFSSTAENACHIYSRKRCRDADILIRCHVNLGRVLSAAKGTMDRQRCWDMGYDSVKVVGMDIYAQYNAKKIQILAFKKLNGSQWFHSMAALREFDVRQQQHWQQLQQQQQRQQLQQQQYQQTYHQHHYNNGSGGELCFPAEASVTLADGSTKTLSDLKIGDAVMSKNDTGITFSEVYAFGHRDPTYEGIFCMLGTDSGHTIALSAEHLLFVEGQGFVPAGSVGLGAVLCVHGKGKGNVTRACVTNIHQKARMGLFAPMTLEGTIFIDGVAASCYAVLRHHALFHFAMVPIRALYCISKASARIAHRSVAWRLKGAHAYIDMLSLLAPCVRFFKL